MGNDLPEKINIIIYLAVLLRGGSRCDAQDIILKLFKKSGITVGSVRVGLILE